MGGGVESKTKLQYMQEIIDEATISNTGNCVNTLKDVEIKLPPNCKAKSITITQKCVARMDSSVEYISRKTADLYNKLRQLAEGGFLTKKAESDLGITTWQELRNRIEYICSTNTVNELEKLKIWACAENVVVNQMGNSEAKCMLMYLAETYGRLREEVDNTTKAGSAATTFIVIFLIIIAVAFLIIIIRRKPSG